MLNSERETHVELLVVDELSVVVVVSFTAGESVEEVFVVDVVSFVFDTFVVVAGAVVFVVVLGVVVVLV